jgi:hypothetical protein
MKRFLDPAVLTNLKRSFLNRCGVGRPTGTVAQRLSEFMAAVQAAKISKCLRSTLINLGFPSSGPQKLLNKENKATW